ncbi:MAG: TAXI family TRAP transporter solute-binding subunit [Clostridia bacterium]|nr:TAXI family TRAP transporter solute-binding subunit [Clostridia bacterium]
MKKFFAALLAIAMLLSSVAFAEVDAYSVSGDLVLGTASSTGTFYYVGAAIGNAVSEAGKLKVWVQATAGSGENVQLVQSGDIQIGMGNSDALYGAYTGTMTYANDGAQDIQEVAALYQSQLHVFVNANSGINDISELKGKKVCVGSQGTSYLFIDEAILAAYGITLDDITPFYMNYAEAAEALANGDIDAAFQTGGYPIAGIQQYAATTSFRMLPVSEEVCDAIIAEYPFAIKSEIPAGTYENQANEDSVMTLSYLTCLFCSSNVDDDQIYAFCKLMMETLPTYIDTNAATRQISTETIATPIIPFNPGAERYYREIGLITD